MTMEMCISIQISNAGAGPQMRGGSQPAPLCRRGGGGSNPHRLGHRKKQLLRKSSQLFLGQIFECFFFFWPFRLVLTLR